MTFVGSMGRRTRRLLVTSWIVVMVALVAPLVALGDSDDDALRIRLETPVVFDDVVTPECPAFTVHFGISARGKSGSGTNCVQEVVFPACPPGVEAEAFCQEVRALTTLRPRGGEIKADTTLFEIWRCGALGCAVDQRWSGKVVSAKGRFKELGGASVSGGGVLVLGAFGVLSLDEVLLIGGDDEDDDD